MVRVISEKLFSPPRSRHSSGETVDKELAARAVEVLSALNSRRLELSDYESSSDSHWDSEVDVEGDCAESGPSREPVVGDGKNGGTDILRKRKERRRERNKLSAQAYRVRRKEQTAKQQTVLKTLQEQNTSLKSSVRNLEKEIEQVRHSLRQHYPATFTLPSFSPSPSPITTCPPDTPTPTPPSPPGASATGTAVDEPASFPSRQMVEKRTSSTEGHHHHHNPRNHPHHHQCQTMDNHQSRQQQVSPVVDNFHFSKPLATPPSGAINVPPTFTFPTSPVMGSTRHSLTAASPFLPTALPTISEKPDSHYLSRPHHPNLPLQQQPGADLNANANSFAHVNANTINANTNMFGMYQNSNRINNNNNCQSLPLEVGACADVGAQQSPFMMCKV